MASPDGLNVRTIAPRNRRSSIVTARSSPHPIRNASSDWPSRMSHAYNACSGASGAHVIQSAIVDSVELIEHVGELEHSNGGIHPLLPCSHRPRASLAPCHRT